MSRTPGPWKAGNPPVAYPSAKSRLVLSPSGIVATVQNEEDSRLIAAAPDLLEACRKIKEWNSQAMELDHDLYVALRRAIEKAETPCD